MLYTRVSNRKLSYSLEMNQRYFKQLLNQFKTISLQHNVKSKISSLTVKDGQVFIFPLFLLNEPWRCLEKPGEALKQQKHPAPKLFGNSIPIHYHSLIILWTIPQLVVKILPKTSLFVQQLSAPAFISTDSEQNFPLEYQIQPKHNKGTLIFHCNFNLI